MPRRPAILPILACLAIAAAVTVATSWFCALAAPRPIMQTARQLFEIPKALWERPPVVRTTPPHPTQPETWWGPPEAARRHVTGRSQGCLIRYELEHRYKGEAMTVGQFRFGWPVPAMEYWQTRAGPRHFIASPVHAPGRDKLPTHIYWPGFVANFLLYAAIALLLWPGATLLRRRLRTRRGRCGACGYDTTATSGFCPECGTGTPPLRGGTVC